MIIPPWPEACAPTPEQWLDWLLENDREHQLIIAERVTGFADVANRCVAGDHKASIEATRHAIERLNEAASETERLYLDSTRHLAAKLNGYRRLLDRITTARDPRRLP